MLKKCLQAACVKGYVLGIAVPMRKVRTVMDLVFAGFMCKHLLKLLDLTVVHLRSPAGKRDLPQAGQNWKRSSSGTAPI